MLLTHTLTYMRKLLVGLLAINLTACGSIPQLPCPGSRYYDVQYCRGEKDFRIPNFYGEAAQRQDKCLKCIDVDQNCFMQAPPKQCKINNWKYN
jgi:hypothetical protein